SSGYADNKISYPDEIKKIEKQLLLLKTKQELLNSSVKSEEAQAEATAKTNKQTSAAIEAIKYVNKLNEQSLTIAEKRDKAT
ncbi:hypothetical protein JG636_18980, partial [Vibrio cholerae]